MVSKSRDFWQGDRKRSNLGSCIEIFMIKVSDLLLLMLERAEKERLKND